MSSTNRGAVRSLDDYYRTPLVPIHDFLLAAETDHGLRLSEEHTVLDPCAGGDADHPMPYPTVIETRWQHPRIVTLDIRPDSPATNHGDFLKLDLGNLLGLSEWAPDLVISNPPFAFFTQFVDRSLEIVRKDGLVIFLARLNLLGSKMRLPWWQARMPTYGYVHSQRISFTEDGHTDSIEYCHFIWKKGTNPKTCAIRVI